MDDQVQRWLPSNNLKKDVLKIEKDSFPEDKERDVSPNSNTPDNSKDLNEFVLNWLRVLVMGGSCISKRDLESDLQAIAKRSGIELYDLPWLAKKLSDSPRS